MQMKMTNKIKAGLLASSLALATSLAAAMALVVAPGTAMAAGSCSPAMGTMQAWMYDPSAQVLTFVDSTGGGAQISFPSSVAGIDGSWGGVDNPAPLLYYAKLYPNNVNLPSIFSSCQGYAPQVIQQMGGDRFSPSEVGGVNPSGVAAVSPPSQGTTTSSTTKPSTTTSPQTSTQSTPTSPQGTQTTGSSTPKPQYPESVVTPPAGWLALHNPQQILNRDEHLVADGGTTQTTSPPQGSPLPYAIGGVVLLVIATIVLVRRRAQGATMSKAASSRWIEHQKHR